MQEQESGIKSLDREELKKRLEALAERSPEAVAVFAARCALRVLPFTAVKGSFDFWFSDKRAAYARSIFIACIVGLESKTVNQEICHDVDSFVKNAAHAASNSIAAFAVDAAESVVATVCTETVPAIAYAAFTALADANEYISILASRTATIDLNRLEHGGIESVKYSPLWLDSPLSDISDRIADWSEAMIALQFGELVQVYEDLLLGKHYPKEKIFSLINDWYQQYGHQDAEESASDSESNADQLPQTIIKYDQTHAHLYDGLAQKDSLGRQRLVDAMADILAAEKNTEHQTIGLLGDWGAGKSTFIEFLKKALKKRSESKFLFAEFNAWEYEHTDHMQAGVAREALKGLVADLGCWEELKFALKFSWRVNRLQTIRTILMTVTLIAGPIIGALQFEESLQQWIVGISIGGVSALVIWKFFIQSLQALVKSPLANEWKGLLSLPDYERYLGTIPVMKQQILKLCNLRLGEKQRRLLFVVDDLDRCSHGGVVKTLEAVRLIMGIKQVTVIIAIDQCIALASLALHYKDLAGYHEEQDPGAIARDYLGKVIQLPVQLNAADGETVAAFVDEVLLNGANDTATDITQAVSGHSIDNDHLLESALKSEPIAEKSPEPELIKPQPSGQDSIASPPSQVHSKETTEYRLSPDEKEAFKEQVKLFGFHNPRQLKRLYNSFNLLRHLYGSEQVNDHMQALFWLEYLNSLPAKKRQEAEKNRNKYVSLDDERYKLIKSQVEPFVLPALMVSPKKDQAQSSSESMTNR